MEWADFEICQIQVLALQLELEHIKIDISMPTAAPNGSEIIDLTNSPSEPIVISDDDHLIVTSLSNRKKKSSKKNSRLRIVEEGEIAESSARTSRNHSRERSSPSKTTRSQNGGIRPSRNGDFATIQGGETWKSKRHGEENLPAEQSPRCRRSYSPGNRRRSTSPPSPSHNSALFFVDVQPAEVKPSDKPSVHGAIPVVVDDEARNLLLPAHVSVFGVAEGSIPVEILPPSDSEGQDDDYIEYLDYDDRKVSCSKL
jgi:hypothetical protein